MQEFFSLLTQPDMQRIGLLALLWILNFLSAVTTALFSGTFSIKRLPDFIVVYFKWVIGFALFSVLFNVGLTLSAMVTAFNSHLGESLSTFLNNIQLYGIFCSIAASLFWSAAKNIGALIGLTVKGVSAATAQAPK